MPLEAILTMFWNLRLKPIKKSNILYFIIKSNVTLFFFLLCKVRVKSKSNNFLFLFQTNIDCKYGN